MFFLKTPTVASRPDAWVSVTSVNEPLLLINSGTINVSPSMQSGFQDLNLILLFALIIFLSEDRSPTTHAGESCAL